MAGSITSSNDGRNPLYPGNRPRTAPTPPYSISPHEPLPPGWGIFPPLSPGGPTRVSPPPNNNVSPPPGYLDGHFLPYPMPTPAGPPNHVSPPPGYRDGHFQPVPGNHGRAAIQPFQLPGGADPMQDLPESRKRELIAALKAAGGMGAGRLLNRLTAAPLFGGFGGGSHTMSDYPTASLPTLNFSPFLAQAQRGVPHLAPQMAGGAYNDQSGAPSPSAAYTQPTDSFAGQAQAEALGQPYGGSPAPMALPFDQGGVTRSLVGVDTQPPAPAGAAAQALAYRLARLGGF